VLLADGDGVASGCAAWEWCTSNLDFRSRTQTRSEGPLALKHINIANIQVMLFSPAEARSSGKPMWTPSAPSIGDEDKLRDGDKRESFATDLLLEGEGDVILSVVSFTLKRPFLTSGALASGAGELEVTPSP